jgi:tetratricopeptide (TPR) repeat protein
MESYYVKQEVRVAGNYKRPVLPLHLGMVSYAEELELHLAGHHYIQIPDSPPGQWLPALLDALSQFPGLDLDSGQDEDARQARPQERVEGEEGEVPPCLEVFSQLRQAAASGLTVDCHEDFQEKIQVYNRGTGPARDLAITPEPSDWFESDGVTCQSLAGRRGRYFHLIYRPHRLGKFQLPRLRVTFRDRKAALHEQTVEGAPGVEVIPNFKSREVVGESHLARISDLSRAAGRVAAGKGQVVFISGEAGVGKSRVLNEFLCQRPLPQATFLEGNPRGGSQDQLGFDLLTSALKPWFGLQEKERGEVARQKIQSRLSDHPGWEDRTPFFASLLGVEESASPSPQGKTDQDQVFKDLHGFLYELSSRNPLILLFEDLQWGDQSSLSFIEALGKSLDQVGGQILVCGTFRTREAQRLEGLKGSLLRLVDTCREYPPLERLGEEEGLRMIEGIAPGLPAGHKGLIFHRSNGLPLYISEVLRDLYERHRKTGALQLRDDLWVLPEDIQFDLMIPTSIREIIHGKLKTFGEPTRSLLDVLAAAGRQFQANVLKQVAGRAIDEDLGALCRAGLIRKVDRAAWDDRYVFADTFTREVVYEELEARGEAPGVHLRIAGVLEGLQKDDPQPTEFGKIGRHYEEGGDLSRAVPYLIRAGEAAHARYAYPEAVGFYTRAIEHLERDFFSPKSRGQFLPKALLGLADSGQALGHYRGALEEYQRVLEMEGVEGSLTAKAHEEMACCHMILGDIPSARAEVRLAQEAYEGLADLEGYARGLLLDGRLAADQGDYQRALELWEECRAVAEETGRDDLRAEALTCLGMAHRRLERFEEARGYFDRSLPLLRKLKDTRGLACTLQTRGILLRYQGRFEEALQDLHEALGFVQKAGDRLLEAACRNEIGAIYRQRGMGREASPFLEEALRLSRALGYRLGEATALRHLGAVARGAGDSGQAVRHLQESLKIYEEIGQHPEGRADAQRELEEAGQGGGDS